MKRLWVALAVVLTGCSFRIDWPRHNVFVTVVEPGLRAMGGSDSLTQLRVTVDSVRLIACEEEAPVGYAWLWDRLIPSAHAHGLGSPTELKIPGIMRFLGEQTQFTLGVLEPPPNKYCEVLISFAPADDDAMGQDSDTMEGLSLSAEFAQRRLTSVLKADIRRTLVPPLILPDSHDVRVNLELIADGMPDAAELVADSPNWEVLLWDSILESFRVEVQEVP